MADEYNFEETVDEPVDDNEALYGEDAPTDEAPVEDTPTRKRGPMSEETKAKIRAAHTTPEALEAHRQRATGRTHTEETKAKIREAHKARWDRIRAEAAANAPAEDAPDTPGEDQIDPYPTE